MLCYPQFSQHTDPWGYHKHLTPLSKEREVHRPKHTVRVILSQKLISEIVFLSVSFAWNQLFIVLAISLLYFSVQIRHNISKNITDCSTMTWTAPPESTHREVTPLDFVGQFRIFRSFLGLANSPKGSNSYRLLKFSVSYLWSRTTWNIFVDDVIFNIVKWI